MSSTTLNIGRATGAVSTSARVKGRVSRRGGVRRRACWNVCVRVCAGASGAPASGGAAGSSSSSSRESEAVQFLLDECGFTERVNAQLVIDKVKREENYV